MRTGLLISVARVWMSICGLMTTVAAVYFLDPTEFGLFAVGSSVGLFCFMIVGAGAHEAFVGRIIGEEDAQAFATWSGLLAAVLLALGTWASAAWGPHLVAATLAAFALSSMVQGLTCIADAKALRDDRGGRILTVVTASDTVGVVVTLSFIAAGFQGYALVLGKVAQSITFYAVFCLVIGRVLRPAFALDDMSGHLRRFSAFILPRFSTWADGYAADLVVGGLLSPAAAGQFRLAARFASAFQSIITNSLNIVLLAEVGRRAHGALKVARMMRVAPPAMVLIGFASVGFSLVVASVLARVGNGVWVEAALIMIWLSAATPAMILNGTVIALLTSRDAMRLIAEVQFARLLLATLGLVTGAALGAAGSAAGRSILSTLALAAFLSRAVRHPAHARRLCVLLILQTLVAVLVAIVATVLACGPAGTNLTSLTSVLVLPACAVATQLVLTFPYLALALREIRLRWLVFSSRRGQRHHPHPFEAREAI